MTVMIRCDKDTKKRIEALKRPTESIAQYLERTIPATTPGLDKARQGLDEARKNLEEFHKKFRAEQDEEMKARLVEINKTNEENRRKLDEMNKEYMRKLRGE